MEEFFNDFQWRATQHHEVYDFESKSHHPTADNCFYCKNKLGYAKVHCQSCTECLSQCQMYLAYYRVYLCEGETSRCETDCNCWFHDYQPSFCLCKPCYYEFSQLWEEWQLDNKK